MEDWDHRGERPRQVKLKFFSYPRMAVNVIYKMLSYRRETALQGALQFSQKVEDWNWETIFYGHYRLIFNHNRPENLSNSVKKRKIRAITAFKVIQVSSRSVPIESPYAISY